MAITGIGGLFFRAADPSVLQQWYQSHLGVVLEGGTPWIQDAGPTVIVPFARDTGYWPETHPWMINFRVSDLDALLARLREAGVSVRTDPSWDASGFGRFARIEDPEGNPIELWEPQPD